MDIQLLKDLANYIFQINKTEIEYLKLEDVPSSYINSVLIPIKSSSVDTLSSWSESSDYENIEPHVRFQEDMDSELKEKIYHLFFQLMDNLNVDKEELKNYIDSVFNDICILGQYSESDYYRNFSNYVVYKIDVKSLLTNFCGQEITDMYNTCAEDIILEKKPKIKM